MTETIKNWLTQLYEREIKEALGSISNERIWLMGTDVWELAALLCKADLVDLYELVKKDL